jgi:ubiquinone/menaquinone biosynthesis C-methylase UbiE/uncharacterized protein YbaR (Trm112 family)
MNVTIDPYVQEYIAGTNGVMYVDLVGKLKEYPIPEIPIEDSNNGLFLDIGIGWGRWMVAAARKGYVPMGIDIKLESCIASRKVLQQLGHKGITVQADLKALPFQSNIFDKVWSFSVIQHTHRQRANNCLKEIYRILQPEGSTTLEYPIKHGIRNTLFILNRTTNEEDDYDSWCVRYYSVKELKEIFDAIFGNFSYHSHCYFGIGILPIDMKYVHTKYKPLVLSSLLLTKLSDFITPLRLVADSIFVDAVKPIDAPLNTIQEKQTLTAAFQRNDLSELEFLQHIVACPISQSTLTLDSHQKYFVNEVQGVKYPIIQGIPVLMEEAAIKL